ncbi:MAG: SEC-C metal-binding domain-containing protein, partial [Candidatus Omnitrophica bacterium]|nr:SEC-C metal-binding domain-containing protein [Candidatus Omnitrophota bacterium]
EEHEKVVRLGGLHVLATERHEARRIDNQLRGRCGRQGDPGSSRFYVSLGDDLMRLFGSDRITGLMDKLGLEEGQVIEHPWVSGSIEIAQRRVEQHNFEIRKQLLEFDNVMNKQREIVYGQRRQILEGVSLKENIQQIISRMINDIFAIHFPDNLNQEPDLVGLSSAIKLRFGVEVPAIAPGKSGRVGTAEDVSSAVLNAYEEKEKSVGTELMRHMERMVFLQIIDAKWKDHLYAMDTLREGIGLRSYGQRDPLVEYKREAFEMFAQMVASIEEEAAETVFKLQMARPERVKQVFTSVPQEFSHPEAARFQRPTQQEPVEQDLDSPEEPPSTPAPIKRDQPKVGRNDPCPCGSGKKYKKCHGQ